MTARGLVILAGCLVVACKAEAQIATVKLNGGLEAAILKIGRNKDHEHLTLSFRILNKSSNTASLMLIDRPVATDNTGVTLSFLDNVSGITRCQNWEFPSGTCIGIPEKSNFTIPLQSITQLDPDPNGTAGIVINITLRGGRSEGPLISFSAHLFVRFVSDPLKDEEVPDATKYRQFRMMTLSFPPMRVEDAP